MRELRNIVVVGGCGHVGLPLGLMLASRTPAKVQLLDIDEAKVAQTNACQPPFLETGLEDLMKAVIGTKALATTDRSCLKDADVVITVVGTPIDKHLNPTVNELKHSIDQTVENMKDGALLVLRSTVYPGVTGMVHQRLLEKGRKIHLAFCPERIAEGKAIEELVSLPQIVSAFDEESAAIASQLFSHLTKNIIVLQPLEAELAKLFTNSWRYLNFAISNQFYILAESYGLDFYRIYDAVTRDYPRMRSFAKAGFAAGPCLVKDTMQLSAFANNNFFLGHAAMLINEGLPNFLVDQLSTHSLPGKTVAILGMAFKADSDDIRDSLSYKLKNLLEVRAKRVVCTDPYVGDPTFVPLEEAIAQADIIVLGVPHSQYKQLQLPKDKVVIDCWGLWPKQSATASQATAANKSPVFSGVKA